MNGIFLVLRHNNAVSSGSGCSRNGLSGFLSPYMTGFVGTIDEPDFLTIADVWH